MKAKKSKAGGSSERYARQLALPEIGRSGQARLSKSRVLVVGVGGLGSPAALYLAAAGVGTLGIIDDDTVDLSNLQRQILYKTSSVGSFKVESAEQALKDLNPEVTVEMWPGRINAGSGAYVVGRYDFVIDATDSFASKLLVATACHQANRPYVHAGIEKFGGQVMTVLPGKTACYACIFGSSVPADPEFARGPLGAVPGFFGSVQAAEAVKFILKRGQLLVNRMLVCDLLESAYRVIPVHRNQQCKLCGNMEKVKAGGSVARTKGGRS